MPKEEWGVKRVCPTTGKRFYDLNRTPIISPYTGETVELDANTGTRVAIAEKVEDKLVEPDAVEADVLLEEDEVVDPDIADDILEEDDDDTVPLEEIADVAKDDEEG